MSNRRKIKQTGRTSTAETCLACDRNDIPVLKTAFGRMCFECLGRMEATMCRVCHPGTDTDNICEKHFNQSVDKRSHSVGG